MTSGIWHKHSGSETLHIHQEIVLVNLLKYRGICNNLIILLQFQAEHTVCRLQVKKSVEVEGECTFYGACRYDRRDFLFQVGRTVVMSDFFLPCL
jgi:hypothetical protein